MRLDLLHLARSIRRSPASAAAAALTLALTLAAGASIFAVVDAVLLTPPPFANPESLMIVGETPTDQAAGAPRAVGYATFEAWRARAGSIAAMEAFDGTNLTMTELGAAERVSATDVTPGFLSLLGVTPIRGRTFAPDDVGQPVAIVSSAFWRGKLAGDPNVIGRRIVLGAVAHTIVGVLPDSFAFAINACDIWRPIPLAPARAARTGYRVIAMARLAGGSTPLQLTAALDEVSRTSSPPSHAVATHVATAIAGNSAKTLGVLAAAAALALLIAIANLAGLLIVRSIDRRRELAVRSALGARHSEIARQLLLEAAAIVAAGTVAGVLLASWMTPAVGRLALAQFGALANRDVAISWRVIGLVAAVAFVCAAICGSLPGLGMSRWTVADVLRRGRTPPAQELTLRRLFVTAEVALAFVLLVSMGLLGRTLVTMLGVNPGFDPRGVMALKVSLPVASYPTPDRIASFYSALQHALDDRLGAGTNAIVDELPLTHDRGRVRVSARPREPGLDAVVRTVSADYFDVMRIPLAAGRPFDARDDAAAPPRVVISESLARRLFASEPASGRRVWVGARAADIIAVTGDVKHRALDDPIVPTIYITALQSPSPSTIVVVRSARPEADVAAAVREEVARLDGHLPVYGVRSLPEIVAASPGVPARRLLLAAFAGFALLALLLSTIGLFGVAAHEVASRRAELAVRIALGAAPARILGTTLGQGAVMLGSGLALGGLLSVWAARGLSAAIATASADVLSIGLAAGVLVATGVAAVLPAALRAARTDPLIALRSE